MEHKKIIKLLEFLTQDSQIELNKEGIIIKNFQYATNIKIEGLPDYNYKIEFALQTKTNPFKKLGENKGESFVFPFDIMEIFLKTLSEEMNKQQNHKMIEEKGYAVFNKKKEEILNILHSDIKVEEEFQYFVVPYATELFNNVIMIEKNDEEKILSHEFINLSYTFIDNIKDENNGLDPTYTTQTIKLVIPSIEIQNYKVLYNNFNLPVKNNYAALIDILRQNNQDENMNKLLLYTKLDSKYEDSKKSQHKKI